MKRSSSGVECFKDIDDNGPCFTVYKDGEYVTALLAEHEVEQMFGKGVKYWDGLDNRTRR